MTDAKQIIEPTARPAGALLGRPALMRNTCGLVLLILALLAPAASRGADSYPTVIEKHLSLESPPLLELKHTPQNKAEEKHVTELKQALVVEAQLLPKAPYVAPPPPISNKGLLLAIAFPLAAAAALGTVSYLAKRRLDSLIARQAAANQSLEALLAEDPSVARFFSELREGLHAAAEAATGPLKDVQPQTPATNPLQEFFASISTRIASLRRIFSEISRASDDEGRQQLMIDFAQQVSGLKDSSRSPELRPVWLLASALEGLLNQLSNNLADVTPSALGTAASAVDLLEALSVPGLDPDLATEPPVHLLAVDDDPVSRLAVSFALKKAFHAPDLAPDGETALNLIARQTYDVIFLDVDMPGMDGYELCTRIHQTDSHRTTPVVFVTRHSDFNSRAKSTLSGGEDLIAKPFLAFEITVKALTLALRGRLQGKADPSTNRQGAAPAIAATLSELAAAVSSVTTQPSETPAAEKAGANGCEGPSHAGTSGLAEANGKSTWELSDRGFQALFKAPTDDSPEAFLRYAPVHLEALRNQLQAAQHAVAPDEVQKFLGQVYVGMHALSSEAERAGLRAWSRLSSALEGMLKKLLARKNFFTPSTLNAASAALELLDELCGHTGPDPDLAQPPVRILIVDDDPVARRGISNSIQLVFGRPDDADSGEAALAMASEKPYDLVLLDVLMPGIDGFTTCSKIHKTNLNRRTPVVFVTSHDDLEARSKAVVSGGCGFIPKPVLSSQIKLTALTFILRTRLTASESAPTRDEAFLELA